jgi:glycosyltransferase involved in cell wall biosynthesis
VAQASRSVASTSSSTSCRVSVLLPIRNEERNLPEALASLAAQTEPNFEILAIDDGSTDRTPAILESFSHRDPRLRPFRQEPLGLVAALERGLAEAGARYIARMDADDVAAAERLRLQADFLDANPAIGLVASQASYLGDRAANRGLALWVDWTNSLATPDTIARERFVESPFVHPTVMFRRELVSRHGGYCAGPFPEDYELWLRWLEAGVRMAKVEQSLLEWRERPERLTRTDPRYSLEAFSQAKAPYLVRWLASNNPHHPRLIVWGAGRTTRRRLAPALSLGLEVEAWVDIDPKKIGWNVNGAPVIAPASLPPPGEAFVLAAVGKRGARALIETELHRQGYTRGLDCLFCA